MYKVKKLETENELLISKEIRTKVFVNEQNVPINIEIDKLDNEKSTIHIGLFKDNKMLATGRILNIGTNNIYLGRIAVLKEYRGLGIGKILVLEMENIAKEMTDGKLISHLGSQLSAEKFYESIGYTRIDNNVYLEAGIYHITMKKVLK